MPLFIQYNATYRIMKSMPPKSVYIGLHNNNSANNNNNINANILDKYIRESLGKGEGLDNNNTNTNTK